jgi:hypothetical protein
MPRQGAPLLLRGGGVGEGVRVPHATCKWPYTRRLLARWSLSRHPARLLPTRGGGGHTWTSRSWRRLTAMGGPRTASHRLISLSSFASTSANGFSACGCLGGPTACGSCASTMSPPVDPAARPPYPAPNSRIGSSGLGPYGWSARRYEFPEMHQVRRDNSYGRLHRYRIGGTKPATERRPKAYSGCREIAVSLRSISQKLKANS